MISLFHIRDTVNTSVREVWDTAATVTGAVRGCRSGTHAEVRSPLFTYLESFHGARRRCSALGYVAPEEYSVGTTRCGCPCSCHDLN